MKKFIVAVMMIAACISAFAATGWQTEQKIIQTNVPSMLKTQPKAACSYSKTSNCCD